MSVDFDISLSFIVIWNFRGTCSLLICRNAEGARGVTRGAKEGTISRAPNHYGGAEKSQYCS